MNHLMNHRLNYLLNFLVNHQSADYLSTFLSTCGHRLPACLPIAATIRVLLYICIRHYSCLDVSVIPVSHVYTAIYNI